MNVKVLFEEITNYVAKHYHIRPQLKYVDDKTIEASYSPGLFIPPAKIAIHIDAMRKDVVCVSYQCSSAVNMLISGAVGHIGNKLPKGVEIDTEEKRINVFLEQIDELEKALKYVQLEDIRFSADGVELVVSLV